MTSVDIRAALLNEMHLAIDAAARDALGIIESRGVEPVYPPGVELSSAETSALANVSLSPELRTASAKILRDVASRPLFQLFALIDGVADPEEWEGVWLGARVILPPDETDQAMWHDDFFDSYWQYAKTRAPDV